MHIHGYPVAFIMPTTNIYICCLFTYLTEKKLEMIALLLLHFCKFTTQQLPRKKACSLLYDKYLKKAIGNPPAIYHFFSCLPEGCRKF